MSVTYEIAIDEMFALFSAAWNAGTASIVGSVPTIRWQGVESATRPAKNSYWCRVSTQQVLEEQTTFKTGLASEENRRYTAIGLVTVQLFCPMSDSQAVERGRQLAVVARNAFRGKQTVGGVWFRNTRILELSPEEDNYRFNIVVDYEYDELG